MARSEDVMTPDQLYESWIACHYPTSESAKMNCMEATASMADAFPELRRVRGYAMVGIRDRPHWWLVKRDGAIVDPTAHQWSVKPSMYREIPIDEEEPHGKCLECGEELYRSRGAQSHFCENCT